MKKKMQKMTVELTKAKEPATAEGIVLALKTLIASEGWAIVTRILTENINYLEKAILDKVDPANPNVVLNDSDIEVLRTKRMLGIDLRNTPENYIRTIEEDSREPENFDPYFRSVEEMNKMRG